MLRWGRRVLAALVLAALLIAVAACGDDESGGADTGPALTQSEGGTVEGGGDEQGTIPTEGTAGDGLVTAGGEDLVAAAAGGATLERFAGRDVSAQNARVQQTAGDAGFWVGGNEARRVFVVVDGGAPDVSDGDRVTFTGVVEPNDDGTTLGVDDQGAEQLRGQGYHVRVQASDLERHR